MSDVRIQDDLYMHVNGDWLKNAVIPSDRSTTGGFANLDQEVERKLMNDFKEFDLGTKKSDIKEIEYATKLYRKVLDTKLRDELGIKPLLSTLDEIKGLNSINDLNNKAKSFVLKELDLPINLGVTEDMTDATKYSFIILGPDTILPDTSYYSDGNEAGIKLMEVYKKMAKTALSYTSLTIDEQNGYLEDTVSFDKLISKRVKSQVEWADYTKNYNPMSLDEVKNALGEFDIEKLLKDIYGNNIPKTLIAYDKRAILEFNLYFNEETFKLYKHWLYVKTLLRKSKYLSLDLARNATTFRRCLMGVEKDPVIEKQAYQLVSSLYSEPIGVYYGRTYFGEEAKKNITSLVKKIIEAYKGRMKTNTFLEEKTKEKAILKLSTIEIKMGYPDFVNEYYSKLIVNDTDSYFTAIEKLTEEKVSHSLNKLWKVVDRSEWAMPGHMVNACYNPSFNDITFPAAILQAPFYSLKQTESENLGGIGAVIGHEISHAFDNNGAQFDEKGNLNNWWTEKDYESFKKLTKDMIDEFDGIEFHGGKVNGELVVSENIADNGGLGVTLEIMHNISGNFKEYFINWAKVWCRKAKEEYILYLLSNDVHSPAELRANIQVRNFDEWYQTFDVKDTDKMYIEPSKRVRIW